MGIVCLWIAAAMLAPPCAEAVTIDGDVSYTSDYVFRGISESGGRSAGQGNVRASTGDGTFLGVFASSLGRVLQHKWGWDYELETYLGHRFDLSQAWSTTVTAVNYSYLGGNAPISNDYQEISIAGSYLDLWTTSLAFIPNAVRYEGGYRRGRYAAYVADTSVQWPLFGRLFLTAGAGYYTSDRTGYAFGNAGLGFEFKSLRLDAGYYFAQDRAQELFPYGRVGSRFAGSVSWHF